MPVTQNYEFPLYDPEDSPDLTLTGREAGAIIAIDSALKNEENGRKAADKVLTDNLADEVADRESADTALGGRIDAEAAARESADTALSERINTEKANRESADTALGRRIDAEAAARGAADTALGGRIDTEKADRESADIALGGRIDAEAAARGAADTALGGRIDTEKADRESADTALGGRIDNAEAEISANSADITGIKGLTYGNGHAAFIENNAGEYDSPALQEIAEQIAALTGGGGGSASNVTVSTAEQTSTNYTGLKVTPTTDGNNTNYDIALNAATKYARGGVTIGRGLNVNPAGIISVDMNAIPSGGITGDTTWAEIEA